MQLKLTVPQRDGHRFSPGTLRVAERWEDRVNEQLLADFRIAKREHGAALERLTPLIRRVAIETLADVLPNAATIEALGELNEDWIPTLRVQRVFDADGRVLFNIDTGHSDRAVENAVDLVDIEYLDVLIDLTGDEYMGHVVID